MSVNWKSIAIDLADAAQEVIDNLHEADQHIDEETEEPYADIVSLEQAVDNCNDRR